MKSKKKSVRYSHEDKRQGKKVAFIPVKKVRQIEALINRLKERKMQGRDTSYPSFAQEQVLVASDLEDIFNYLDDQEARFLRIEEKIELILELIKEIKKRKKRVIARRGD